MQIQWNDFINLAIIHFDFYNFIPTFSNFQLQVREINVNDNPVKSKFMRGDNMNQLTEKVSNSELIHLTCPESEPRGVKSFFGSALSFYFRIMTGFNVILTYK